VLLRALSQLNFRNLVTPRVGFGPGVTAVVGRNAAGKSNLLEALYLGLSGELPYGKISETVRLGESEGYVSATVEREDGVVSTQIGLAPGRKVIRLDGQTVRTYELAKVTAAVLITPEDADLVHGAPALRRAYLDGLLSRLSLRYALLHREYTRVVDQRNAALKHADPALGVWTERLVELGDAVSALRARALLKIAATAGATYAEISGDDKPLGVSLLGAHEDLADALAQSAAEERARGVTVVGPHRGDLLLTLGGHSVQAYGSRGEARTAALALRVAEYELLSEKHREAPVLLLDDFTAELDAGRREFLLQLAARAPQAVVSGTEAPPHARAHFFISGGQLRAEP
jgi:DNA replication and repair protein RecF